MSLRAAAGGCVYFAGKVGIHYLIDGTLCSQVSCPWFEVFCSAIYCGRRNEFCLKAWKSAQSGLAALVQRRCVELVETISMD